MEPILDIAILMIIVSDNTATNLCIDWAGVEGTNALLRELGLVETTLRRKMQDREAIAQNRENVATLGEYVSMMELLYQGKPTPSCRTMPGHSQEAKERAPVQSGHPGRGTIGQQAGWYGRGALRHRHRLPGTAALCPGSHESSHSASHPSRNGSSSTWRERCTRP